MKKANSVEIVIAVIMSILLIPFLLLLVFGGGTTLALSNVFQENREEELFAEFEREGGIHFLYDEVERRLEESEQELGLPEGEKLLEEVISYEDVSSVSYGIYSALLSGEIYHINLSVQKERIKKNVEAYYDRHIEEQELPEGVDREFIKKNYLDEANARIDIKIAQLEKDLNRSLSSVYNMDEIEHFKTRYGIAGYGEEKLSVAWIHEMFQTAYKTILAVLAVLVLLLLVSHLFRPSGFLTAGIMGMVSGALLFLFAAVLKHISLVAVFPEYEMPDAGVYAVCEKLVFWLADGYHRFGVYSALAGAVLLAIGIILLLFRRKTGTEVGIER